MGIPTDSRLDDTTIDSVLRQAAAGELVSLPGGFTGTERYELVRRLGEGGFGVVYEAIDHREHERVALKVMRDSRPEQQYRLKHEFRGLAELNHPNLARLFELTATDQYLFFTMELLDGVPLLDSVRRSPERIRAALRQLASGLSALHRAGKLHRDVKPSNVLVERSGRVVLLDFGLAIDMAADQSAELAGTPLYMSPEQCALERLTEASDWYAVGLVLYEALTGARPFPGTPDEVIAAKQHGAPPPPSSIATETPADLDELCVGLLARDPAARPTGDEVLRRLSDAAAPPSTAPPSERVVGRETELAALLASFERSRRGGFTVTLLRGPSGIGKSAVLRCFLDEVRRRHADVVILAGRCYERESVPYKALDPVIDQLARFLRRLPELDAEGLVPRDASALVRLFPALLQVPSLHRPRVGRAEAVEPAEVKSRGVAALRELIARLADRRPVVICVDDLHWGDADSAALLGELSRPPDPPAVCFVASFQEEEAATSPLIRRLVKLNAVAELRLTPLGSDQAGRLAAAVLADLGGDPARAQAIAAESGGSPFLVTELARHDGEGHADLAGLVQRRLARLAEPAQRLLEVVALLGYPVEPELAARVTGIGDQLRDALAALRSERLVRGREVQGERLVEVYHHRIGELVLCALDGERRRALHVRIAEALDARGGADPLQIAQHLRDAGDPRALAYTVAAARWASAALAFDHAARLYATAVDLGPPDAALALAHADALSTAGRGLEAADLYLVLAGAAAGRGRIELMRRAAEELLLNGHIDRGYDTLLSVLRSLGLRMPASRSGVITRLLGSRAWLAMRGLRFRQRDESAIAERDLLRVDTLGSAALGISMVDPVLGAALQAEHLRLALRIGEPCRLVAALCLEAGLRSIGGQGARASTRRALEVARRLAEQLPDEDDAPAQLAVADGTVALFEGRWLEANQRLGDAEARFRRRVPHHGSMRSYARLERYFSLFCMGRSGEASRALPPLIGETEERGDLIGWTWLQIFEIWVLGCAGRTEKARATIDRVRERWPRHSGKLETSWLEFGLEYAAVHIHLVEDDGEGAWRRLVEQAWTTLRKAFHGQLHRLMARWLRARAALARALVAPAHRAAMLGEAERCAYAMAREGAAWGLAVATTVRACIASQTPNREAALKLLGEAEPELEAHHLEALLAAVRQARGQLIGGDLGGELVRRAERWMFANDVVSAANHAQLPGIWDR